jgi:hypothetical protein
MRLLPIVKLEQLSSFPRFSIWFAATFLALIWTFLWFFVFFTATFVLDVSTPVRACLITFWLAVFVESILKAGENTNVMTRLSRPYHPDAAGDEDFKLSHAANTSMWGLGILGIYFILTWRMPDVFAVDTSLQFVGQSGENSFSAAKHMVTTNLAIIRRSEVFFPIFIGTFFRIMIYKRRHGSGAVPSSNAGALKE